MGTKKSHTSETQATSTASTTAPQTTPVTPSFNRTRGRNTAAQPTTTKSADKAAGAPKTQSENQQSQFAVPDTVRRSGRKTTLPRNLIHDSVIETPINRNRRESAASESSRRRNSSASSNKSSRKKQPTERKQAKESSEPPKSNIKLEGQILTSSDEEFPKTHKKGSLYGWRRLPPMTPPTPGRKTWETDSDKEERRGTRGNLGWGPVKEKQRTASEVEDSQEEGDTGPVSPSGQDEATELGKAEAKATAPAPLVIESDDTDRDYDAELSELESSPISTKPRTTSEIPDRQEKEDVEELQEQRPSKRRKLVLSSEDGGVRVEEELKPAEPATSGTSASKPKKIWVPEDDDMDFTGQDFTSNGAKQKDDPHVEEEIEQAKVAPETEEVTMGNGAPNREVAAQRDKIYEKLNVLKSNSSGESVQEEDHMEVDAEETQETATATEERPEVEQRKPMAVEQSLEEQTLDENPSALQDTIMIDDEKPLEACDDADMEDEATNETEIKSTLLASQQEEAAPEEAPVTMEGDVLLTQEEVNPSSVMPQNEPMWTSSSETETTKNLQPIVENVTDEEDLPRPGSGLDAAPVRENISEAEFVFEEEKGAGAGVAVTPDEITTPDRAVMPDEVETVSVIMELSEVGNDKREAKREEDYEVETVDEEDTNLYCEENSNDEAEVEEAEASEDGEEMGIIEIVELEEDLQPAESKEAQELEDAVEGYYAEDHKTIESSGVATAFEPASAPLSDSAVEADEVQGMTNAASEIYEAEIPPSRETTKKEPERESTPTHASSLQMPRVTAEEVEIEPSPAATEEPMAPEVPLQDMDIDEDQGDQQEGDLVKQQGQDNASPSSVRDHMEDTGVEKFRELSLGANVVGEFETARRQEAFQKETLEVTSETYSKTEEISQVTETETEGVVDEIEITVSRTEVEVVKEYTVESKPGEKMKDASILDTESVVKTQKEVDVASASVQTSGEPAEVPQPIENDDEIMEDVERVVEDTPTIENEDHDMQEAEEAEEEVSEKASEAAQEVQVASNGETSEDQTATESQPIEDTTTVTSQQEQEHKDMEQETEEREKESVTEEPDLPYRPVDDLGAENNTLDDDDHITIYSSSSGLPSDDELGPDGLTMAPGTMRSWRKRRSRRPKTEKETVTGVIGDQRDQPQLDVPALDVPSWNGEDDNVEPSAPTAEPQPVTQMDEPATEAGEPTTDLDMDDQEEETHHEFRPVSPELEEEDNDAASEPEINEDVGLPPDLDVPGSEGSAEEYDCDRESSPDAHLFSGGSLMDLLRAVEFVENSSLTGPLQTRKEVLPSRTFKMYGDVWERLGSEVTPKLPHRPEIPQLFPDNIVNLSDWEGIQYTKCPVCSELLGDVILNAMDNAQTTQNAVAEHIENCGKQKGSPESLKSKVRDSKSRIPATTLPARSGEGVRRINLRVKLSDGTYFQNPPQASTTMAAPAPVDIVSAKPVPPPPTLNGVTAQLPKNAAEYAQLLREIEELLPNTRDIFKHLTGEREIHSDSEDSLPDAYEYDPEKYDDAPHPLTDEAYFMKTTPISVFQSRSQESFKRSYDHAFTEQENIISVMAQLQTEYFELEEEVAAREHRMPKRLRPLDSRVVFEDKKEADLYNYKYDPDPKKRGRQDPDAQRTDSVYVGGRELRGRARNRESAAAEFLQGRKKRGPAPASHMPRPVGARGPGRPRKEVPVGTDSGVTSVQPSRDASLDAAVTPQVSPAKRGGKIIRNPRGYNGRNKPAVSLPPTREPSPTPVVQAPPTVLQKRRGRKSNAEKAREAEAAAAAAANNKAEPVKEVAPKQAEAVVPVVHEKRRVSGRGRPPKVQPVAIEVNDTVASQSAPATPSGSASERQFPRPVAIKPAAPKPDTTKPAIPKSPVAKSVGKRREILKIRMSSGGSQKVEQILSPTTASPKLEEEKATESSGDIQTEEFQESPQADLKEETLALALIETGPTAPESFYGSATPTATAVPGPSNATAGNAPAPSTIPPPTVPSSAPPPSIQFVPSRIVSTPTPASPAAAGTPPAGVTPRTFFGNASRRARRGEFINSGVNNDSTPYKTYASGKVVGNAPVQVQMHDRAASPEESRASAPPQPATNVQLDFVMDMTVPQQLIPAPAPAPVPVPVLPLVPVHQATCQPATAPAALPPVSISIMQQHIVSTPKPRGRGGKSSSGLKGAGQSTFLPTITPDNWRLKKGVKQAVKTEGGSGPSPREGSVFRDMSGGATPATSVGSTPITPSAPSFQAAEMAGQNQGREIEWMGPSMQTPPPPAPIMQMPTMPMPPMPNPPMQTPSVPVPMTGGYIHHLPPASHHSAAPTLTPYIKPSVDSPVPPYGGHQLLPIQQLSFVNANPGGAKPKGTRGKTYKKPTMGMDVPKPTKEDEFRALTGGQMDLGKRKRRGRGTGEGLGDIMEGPLAPVPGGYPGQGVIGGGRVGMPPGSPKRIRFETHIGMGSSQSSRKYSQGFDGEVKMYQTQPQQLPPLIPQQPYYPPPPSQHTSQLPIPIHYYPSGPSQELLSQAPTAPMGSQPRSRPTTSSASEQTETQEQMEREETPHSLRGDSEEKVPGEGSFQINMWRPPIPGTIGA
ncbi:hypothetical protein EV426DRAFT_719661 [Tirmania nivea]|nr:hypothetical protein EV426DRAFT_719661 [Tirmania nivea]